MVRLILRMLLGALFMGHGLQKLKGWFGGYGIEGTGQFFESIGLRPGKRHATAAGAAETAGGALLALGLLTPVASAALIGTMATAVKTVHLEKGPWVTRGRLGVQRRRRRRARSPDGDRARGPRPSTARSAPSCPGRSGPSPPWPPALGGAAANLTMTEDAPPTAQPVPASVR